MDGIIVKGIGSFYEILSGDKEYTCRAQKKLRRISAPVPGDHVRFEPGTGEEDGWLEEIYERKNQLIRPAVANVDMLVLVLAPVPQPDMMLIERLLLCAAKEKIQPAIVVNKNDLDASLPQQIREEFSDSALSVFSTSTVSGTGIDELYMALKGKLCCFAGQSAVGKSTLLNALCGLNLETGGLSRKTELLPNL